MTRRTADILFIVFSMLVVALTIALVALLASGCISGQDIHGIALDAARTAATTAVDRVADRLGVDVAQAQTPTEALIVGLGSILTTGAVILHRYRFHRPRKS